jgi:activator of 2-hydroxyglutaryl-CoA dehydratase
MKRVRMEPEFTLIGGILRFRRMVDVIRKELGTEVNVPDGDLVQFTSALGAALLGHIRLAQLAAERGPAATAR